HRGTAVARTLTAASGCATGRRDFASGRDAMTSLLWSRVAFRYHAPRWTCRGVTVYSRRRRPRVTARANWKRRISHACAFRLPHRRGRGRWRLPGRRVRIEAGVGGCPTAGALRGGMEVAGRAVPRRGGCPEARAGSLPKGRPGGAGRAPALLAGRARQTQGHSTRRVV